MNKVNKFVMRIPEGLQQMAMYCNSVSRNYVVKKRLKRGYKAVSNINLNLSREHLSIDNSQLQSYEDFLKELGNEWSLKEEIYFTQT